MGILDFLPKIGAGGVAHFPHVGPQEPQSEPFMRLLKPLLQKVGVGKAPDVVPGGPGTHEGPARPVAIYSHPVLGTLGSVVEHMMTPLGRGAYNVGHVYKSTPPDPRRHWAVQVGDYFHELNVHHNINVIYQNGRTDSSDYKWEKFVVGWTRWDDAAIRDAGEEVIKTMDPVYGVYDNNCQKFTIGLLNKICESGREKVITSYSMFTQTKMGVQIPFLSHDSGSHESHDVDLSGRDEAVEKALAIMGEQTPQLNHNDLGTLGVDQQSGEIVLVHLA